MMYSAILEAAEIEQLNMMITEAEAAADASGQKGKITQAAINGANKLAASWQSAYKAAISMGDKAKAKRAKEKAEKYAKVAQELKAGKRGVVKTIILILGGAIAIFGTAAVFLKEAIREGIGAYHGTHSAAVGAKVFAGKSAAIAKGAASSAAKSAAASASSAAHAVGAGATAAKGAAAKAATGAIASIKGAIASVGSLSIGGGVTVAQYVAYVGSAIAAHPVMTAAIIAAIVLGAIVVAQNVFKLIQSRKGKLSPQDAKKGVAVLKQGKSKILGGLTKLKTIKKK